MKRRIVSIGILLFFILYGCNPVRNKITIGYVQITQDPVLDSAKAGLFHALADSGFVDGKNIRVLNNNAQGDLSMINTILQSFISQNVDMVITNSTPCMAAAAQSVRNTPVVFTVAFSPEQIGMKSVPANLYGIFDPLKADEFVDLLIECIPGLKRVGIPFNNSEPNAEYSVKVLRTALEIRGVELVTASVTSVNDLLMAGQYLSGQKIDALVAAADNTVYLGLPVLAKLATEKKIPLFVTDPLQTEKGAAVGYGVDYSMWGYQSGLKAVEILKGRNQVMSHIEPILNYELTINRQACLNQGIEIPQKVTDRASRILNQ